MASVSRATEKLTPRTASTVPPGVKVDGEVLNLKQRVGHSRAPACVEGVAQAIPQRLKASTVRLIMSAGKNSSWGELSMLLGPQSTWSPRRAWGATPMPIKDRKASVKIAVGMAKVSVTKITPSVLGIMWRKIR